MPGNDRFVLELQLVIPVTKSAGRKVGPSDLAPQVRPRQERREVSLPAFAVLEDRSTISLTVHNLSYDGCKVATPIALDPGTDITLSVMHMGLLKAKVRWYLFGNAGLRFSSDPDDLEELPPRKHQRTPLSAMVTLRRRSGGSYRVPTTDISPDGCNLQFVERPVVDELHWVKFDGLEALEVQVRWVKAFNAGVRFTRPIHPAVFEMLFPTPVPELEPA
jgi:PilZ domain